MLGWSSRSTPSGQIGYYVAFTTEIDDELRARDEAAAAARALHERRDQLLR